MAEQVLAKAKRICEFDLTFFIKENDMFRRFDEVHAERCYSGSELKEMIKKAGLELEGVYHDMSFNSPEKESQRIFYVCRK